MGTRSVGATAIAVCGMELVGRGLEVRCVGAVRKEMMSMVKNWGVEVGNWRELRKEER